MSLYAMGAEISVPLKERNVLIENDYKKCLDFTEENFREILFENMEIKNENLELLRQLVAVNNLLSQMYEKVLYLEEVKIPVLSVVR